MWHQLTTNRNNRKRNEPSTATSLFPSRRVLTLLDSRAQELMLFGETSLTECRGFLHDRRCTCPSYISSPSIGSKMVIKGLHSCRPVQGWPSTTFTRYKSGCVSSFIFRCLVTIRSYETRAQFNDRHVRFFTLAVGFGDGQVRFS